MYLKEVRYMEVVTCKICNRKLKSWKSIQRGIGPTCEQKYLDKLYKEKQITIEDIERVDKREERE